MKYLVVLTIVAGMAVAFQNCAKPESQHSATAVDLGSVSSGMSCNKEGATESRTRYLNGHVAAEASCQSETQTRTCTDGTWTIWWPDSYIFDRCDMVQ